MLLDQKRRELVSANEYETILKEPMFVEDLARMMDGMFRGPATNYEIRQILPQSEKALFDQLLNQAITFQQFKLRIYNRQQDDMRRKRKSYSINNYKVQCLDDLRDYAQSDIYEVSEKRRQDLTKIMDMIYRKDSQGNYLVEDL